MYEELDAITSAMNSIKDALDELKPYPISEQAPSTLLSEALYLLQENEEYLIHEISAKEQKEKRELEREYYSSL